ncbi:MAG: short-chain dehydrogenase [Candidatus Tectimicrobiota bacterium]|nr:MAG: short-chain dehydrogenase [Candidatus Tectomicrobia bacterium]
MDLGLRGKVAIVTGASKGIGRAIAEEFAAEGVHLALCARGQALLQEVAAALQRQHDVQVLPVAADLSTLAGVQTLVRQTVQRFGGVDILVNNAGAIRAGSLLGKPDAEWHEDWALKVFGYVRLMREVFPVLQARGGGRIINIIGGAGRQPNPGYLAGGGANAALMNITKALADEGGPQNILVNAINPGPIRTERWDGLMARLAAERGQTPQEVEAAWLRDNPLRRPGEPREVAALAVFLASPRASYINGAIIPVDGGATRCI